MEWTVWLAPAFALIALLFAAYKAVYVSKAPAGNARMQEIASAIAEGANAFLMSEYRILAIFIVVLFALIALFIDLGTAVCFLLGALFSIGAGFFGMKVATRANVRTANAAMESGMNKALSIAFSGGSVMGMCVVGLGLLGCSLIYITGNINSMFGFSLGAAAFTPRRPTSAPTLSVKSKSVSPRTTPATPPSSRIMSATTSATWPAWAPTSLNPMSERSSRR